MSTVPLSEFVEGLRQFNKSIVDSSSPLPFDPVNESSTGLVRRLLTPLSKNRYLEKDEYLAVVINVKGNQFQNCKIYAIPLDFEDISIEEISRAIEQSTNIDDSRIERYAFYPASKSILEKELPSKKQIIRVYIAKNYPNHVQTNPKDNKFIGLYDQTLNVEIDNTVPPTEQQRALFAGRVRQSFIESIPVSAVTQNDLLILPFRGASNPIITSLPILRPDPSNTSVEQTHEGLDIEMPIGTEIIAPIDMLITNIVTNAGSRGGLQIIGQQLQQNASGPKNDGYRYIFSHLSRIDVSRNSIVRKGQLIGLSGNTGVGTGPHLHFEIELVANKSKIINPIYFLQGTLPITDAVRQRANLTTNSLDMPVVSGDEPFGVLPPTPSALDTNQSTAQTPPTPQAVQPQTGQATFSSSPPTTRPKLLFVNLEVDKAKGIRTDRQLGSSFIKIREDIYEDTLKIKKTLNRYDISFTCINQIPNLIDANLSMLGRVGLEIKLNPNAGMTQKMNINTDDYYIGPDYSRRIGSGYKLKIYAAARRNLSYADERYNLITKDIDIYDIRDTYNKSPPKIVKIRKTFLDLTQIFEDYGFIQSLPRSGFYMFSDNMVSNWFIFQKPLKIIKDYTYKELLMTTYSPNGEPIWNEPELVWNGSLFI